MSPDGKSLVLAEATGALRLWDLANGKVRMTLLDGVHPVYSQFFSPDGKTLASITMDGMVHLWDVVGRKERRRARLPLRAKETLLHLSDDGMLLATMNPEQTVRFWRVPSTTFSGMAPIT